jgi:nitrogen fixation NifU-like protein
MVTEMVKGKTLDEALEVSNKDVVEELGGLPPQKIHCSLLAEEGIRAAIEDYRKKAGISR